jgi:uncharacterized protein YndB with AHSA1/START domain
MSVRHSVTVPLPPPAAFEAFAERLGDWWPPEYTWSQQKLEAIGIEDGMCFERGPHGFRLDWGRVTVREPPGRLVFTWQIGPTRVPEPDPEKASTVEVRFEPEGEGTCVTVEHRDFERHGDGAHGYEQAMNSPQGWPFMLDRYARMAGRAGFSV